MLAEMETKGQQSFRLDKHRVERLDFWFRHGSGDKPE
jgi:hypothetical protein